MYKKYQQSIYYIEKAMQFKNNFGVFHLWLARSYYGKQNYEKALDIIKQGLDIRPWNREMIHTKWLIEQNLNLFKEAEITKNRLDLFFTVTENE